jgi:small subunit ribosomal protein S5
MNKKDKEFDQKLIDLRRVARVSAGGKRFNFRAALIIGNRAGIVGVGIGKGADTTLAIQKAFRRAKNNAIKIPLIKEGSIPHSVETKYKSAKVMIKPAPKGRGLVAGGVLRLILEHGGVANATSKILSSTKNKINIAMAAIEALKKLKTEAKSES